MKTMFPQFTLSTHILRQKEKPLLMQMKSVKTQLSKEKSVVVGLVAKDGGDPSFLFCIIWYIIRNLFSAALIGIIYKRYIIRWSWYNIQKIWKIDKNIQKNS